MPVSGRKLLEAPKKDTSVSAYTSGAAVTPGLGRIAVYIDLAEGDQHRELEVSLRLHDLINRAREEGYRRPSSGTCFWILNINSSRANIRFSLLTTDIIQGDVAIGINGTVRGSDRGSLLIDTCIVSIMQWMAEIGRLDE